MEFGIDNLRSLLGIAFIFGIAWAVSENRRAFPWKIVVGAVALQFVFALVLFGLPFIRSVLFEANTVVRTVAEATKYGTRFVFNYLGDNELADSMMGLEPGTVPALFVFQLLPTIIVAASLSAILWHWKILRVITDGFAFVFRRTMGIGGATSFAVAANVFAGMTEAPLLIKPYLKKMTRSEIFILMTSGFATIAGSVLVIYVAFLDKSGVGFNPTAQLLTASILAAPAAVAIALVMIPDAADAEEHLNQPEFGYESTMDALATGASDGLKIILNVATMLIAALAILYLVNAGLGRFPSIGGEPLSIERILGWIFFPITFMMGVPWHEAAQSGSLLGVKTVLTEFVAFQQLGEIPREAMSDRTRIITVHAICGFANFGSMGILIGGLSAIEPERRTTFLELAWKTLIAGSLATCLSGAVVGFFPVQFFLS